MVYAYSLNSIMKVERSFSDKALTQIRIWAWAAAVLPITALAGIFFVWAFGTDSMFHTALTVGATFMFLVAALWWWWIIWTVAKIMKKDQQVAQELLTATKEIRNLKNLFRETFSKSDK